MAITIRIQYKGDAARKLAADEYADNAKDCYKPDMIRALGLFAIPPPDDSKAIWKSGFILCHYHIVREAVCVDIVQYHTFVFDHRCTHSRCSIRFIVEHSELKASLVAQLSTVSPCMRLEPSQKCVSLTVFRRSYIHLFEKYTFYLPSIGLACSRAYTHFLVGNRFN